MTTKQDVNKPDTAARAPEKRGMRMAMNLSPAFLNPGAGLRVRREAGAEEFCGSIWGTVERAFQHPNHKDPQKNSLRWHGTFGYQKADGTLGEATAAYFPGVVERQLLGLGAPVIRDGWIGEVPPFAADFRVDVWCEADAEGTPRPTAQGYAYGVYNRLPRRRPINHLAPPELRGLLPPEEAPRELLGYDPATGEVIEGTAHDPDDHGGTPHDDDEPEQEQGHRIAAE